MQDDTLDDNILTLEVAIERGLLDDLIEAAQHRGQSISEFVETVLRREVEIVRHEPVHEWSDDKDN
ncbi:MAG: hypothetical protein SOR95_10295 [Sutterella sp.]|nr:hypothetical protein [Sutterella sp.]